MKTIVYSTHEYEKGPLLEANAGKHELIFTEASLDTGTAPLAQGCEAASIFVSDQAGAEQLAALKRFGVKFLALRSAGYNHLDLQALYALGLKAARVPAYSPHAVAEHAVALMLALNRHLIQAHERIHSMNFSLGGLTGFDMYGKTVGVIGAGKIGGTVTRILLGFGCNILVHDQVEQEDLKRPGVRYVTVDELLRLSDIISLHLPLTEQTRYFINAETIRKMKRGVMLVNTSRGAIVKTEDVIAGLKTGQIGYLGLDVYEKEEPLFFRDHAGALLEDDLFARLMTFSNVLITGHQAFLTHEALRNIAATTIQNLDCFGNGIPGSHIL
jgi:D-lactate dehydrogenase